MGHEEIGDLLTPSVDPRSADGGLPSLQYDRVTEDHRQDEWIGLEELLPVFFRRRAAKQGFKPHDQCFERNDFKFDPQAG